MSNSKTLILIIFAIIFNAKLMAYDNEYAHKYITEAAINKSILDMYLKNYLSLSLGAGTAYNGKIIIELAKNGSFNEDLSLRARNHFWNPLKDDGVYDLITGLPNRSWAIGYNESGWPLYSCGSGSHWSDGACNDYSWRKAREHYYAALTGETNEIRNDQFKKMYESIGRVLHLIQDMGVPAHTRNDFSGHLDFIQLSLWEPKSTLGNLYESYVKNTANKNINYISGFSDAAIIPSFDTLEEYWDNGEYTGVNPDLTMGDNTVGLAEYTNANFVSRFTMFTNNLSLEDKHYFPFPNESSLQTMPSVPQEIIAEDGKTDFVRYRTKAAPGECIENFLAEKYFFDRLLINSENDMTSFYRLAYFLDDNVHKAYAAKLIPKAIAYSAGLINYFFRGTLSINDNTIETFDDRYRIHLSVRNTTATSEEMSNGSVCLVIRYPIDETNSGYITVFDNEHILQVPRGTPIPLTFDIPREGLPNHELKGLLDLFVVYKGTLSGTSIQDVHETDAVCLGHQEIEYSPMIREEVCKYGGGGVGFYSYTVCPRNLAQGCRYRLSIENRQGCPDCIVTFLDRTLDYGHQEVGCVIDNPREGGLIGTCQYEVAYYHTTVEDYGPDRYYFHFDIVLRNLTTGMEVYRLQM